MPVKMTGRQYKAFLAASWGPDPMWEDTEILRNGKPVEQDNDSDPNGYADEDMVTIVAGTIIPDQSVPPGQHEHVDAVKFARQWLKAQSVVTLLVEVAREDADAVTTMINRFDIDQRKPKVIGRI